jgi:hypothetical protein
VLCGAAVHRAAVTVCRVALLALAVSPVSEGRTAPRAEPTSISSDGPEMLATSVRSSSLAVLGSSGASFEKTMMRPRKGGRQRLRCAPGFPPASYEGGYIPARW